VPVAQRWWGWGSADKHASLEDHPALGPFLDAHVGPAARPVPVPSLDTIHLPRSKATRTLLADLSRALTSSQIQTDAFARLTHAMGKAYTDLMRLRLNAVRTAPDVVVLPASDDQVERILAYAERHQVAIVPFGGGTSVTEAVESPRALNLCLDLGQMQGMRSLDETSHLAEFGAGTLGPQLEQTLQAKGFTLGHFPQSFECSTVGGWIASRSSGQNSIGYGRIEDMVYDMHVLTPAGPMDIGRAPASAAGPSLKEVLLGSEGTLGIITQATLRIRPRPVSRDYRAFFFHSFEEGMQAVRGLMQNGPHPALARLSDADETRAGLALSRRPSSALAAVVRRAGLGLVPRLGYPRASAALLILGYEGEAGRVSADSGRARHEMARAGAFPLGTSPGRDWLRDRFHHPYLRDAFLDRGLMVDTFETATRWSEILPLHRQLSEAARQALGERSYVMCHVSHAYETGASLYFTFLAPLDSADPLAQWQRVKKAVTDRIMSLGATLTHHHGIGRSHASWLKAEVGPAGYQLLMAVKHHVDPQSILNPGVMWRPR
jgi:alkyldihydroxyacetonephosphate synthase